MAQGNFTWQRGDITGDIYFDYLRPENQDPVPYLRLYLMIDGSPEAKPVKGLRVLVYGTLAELVYGHVQRQPDRCGRSYPDAQPTEYHHAGF